MSSISFFYYFSFKNKEIIMYSFFFTAESTNPNCKIILDNVPNHIDLDTISLIFENYKYCGECDLVSKSECNHTSTDRQVIIEYSHESGYHYFIS
jgi:hypothetical protein